MSDKYLKADLIAELASSSGITKKCAEDVLNNLTQIIYREAKTGFTLPGVCKMDVVRRKGRYGRIPRTGQRIYIGEHDALRIRSLKRAKHAVAPRHPDLVQIVEEEEATTPQREATPPPAPAAGFNPEGLVSFRCGTCGQEIEAPFDMAGTSADCPACGGHIEVPYVSEPGTVWGRAAAQAAPAAPAPEVAPAPNLTPAPEVDPEAMLGRTIRIELPDDI